MNIYFQKCDVRKRDWQIKKLDKVTMYYTLKVKINWEDKILDNSTEFSQWFIIDLNPTVYY